MEAVRQSRLEPRTPMMAVARISYRDASGSIREIPAKIADMSSSGACLHLKTQIAPNSQLKVRWYREQFSAVSKYCRPWAGEFVIGLQRISVPASDPPTFAVVPPKKIVFTMQTPPPRDERTIMQNKWLQIASRRQRSESASENQSAERSSKPGADSAPSRQLQNVSPERNSVSPQGDLSPIEDIYRAAGILSPRMGYTIHKISDMLRSEHLRGLIDENKRASVLMALDAAGVPVDEVLRDANLRQQAIVTYESNQRRQFEDYWNRKAQENENLQAEMNRITAQFAERINRNLDEIEREKDLFCKWQATAQLEVQRIAEAAELCSKPLALAPPVPADSADEVQPAPRSAAAAG